MDVDSVVKNAMQQPTVQIIIQYVPGTGQLGLQSSNVDDVVKLGMLEMAKSLISEARMKASNSAIAIPQGIKVA